MKAKIKVSINPASINVSHGTQIARGVTGDFYSGAHSVTPSAETQVLHTRGCQMTENVTVNPIPSNYGLITWNGSVLTVS